MIAFDELNVLPDRVVILYEKYATSVIEDIAKRLSQLNMFTAPSAWQMARMSEAGKVYEDAIKA